MWDAATGELLVEWARERGYVNDVCFTQNGRVVVSVGLGGEAQMWDAHSGELLHVFTGLGRAETLHVGAHPDQRTVVVTARDPWVYWLDTATRSVLHAAQSVHPTWSVSPHPSSDRVAVGTWGGSLDLWNERTEKAKASLGGHTRLLNAVTWSPDGSIIATASRDGTVRIWDAKIESLLATIEAHELGALGVDICDDPSRPGSPAGC